MNLCGTTKTLTKAVKLELSDPNNPPTLSGPNSVCGPSDLFNQSPVTFTIANFPGGTTVWEKSPGITIISSTNSSVTVSKYLNENGWIKATITLPCTNSSGSNKIILNKYVRVGIYTSGEVSIIGDYTQLCPGRQYAFYCNYLSSNYQDYQWSISNNSSFSTYADGNAFFVTVYGAGWGTATINVRVNNECGLQTYPVNFSVYENYGCNNPTFTVAPKPSTDETTLTFDKDKYKVKDKKLEEEVKVQIFDLQGTKVYETDTDNAALKINTQNYNKGIYLIYLTTKKYGVEKQKLVIN